MSFKSKFGAMALEDFKQSVDPKLNVGNEGWKGAASGALKGLFFAAQHGKKVRPEVTKKQKELESLTETLRKIAADNGRAAVKEGKLSADDFKEHIEIDSKEAFKGAVMGALFGPFYGAIKSSKLEDTLKAIEEKKKEINAILQSGTPGNESNEDDSADAGEPEAAAKVDGDAAAAAGGTTETNVAGGADPATATDATGKATGEGAGEPPAEGEAPAPADGGDEGATAAEPAPLDGAADAAGDTPADPAAPAEGADPAEAGSEDPAADTVAAGDPATADATATADAATAEVDATADVPDAPVDEVDPEAEVVEEQMEAVDDISEKEQEAHDDVDNLNAATESLEIVVAALECAMETGGLNTPGAILARNNVNTVTDHLKVERLLMPALEDMETPTARIGGASDLKSQVVAFIKRIIDTIKGAFTRFSQWVVEIYKRLTDAYVAIEARANKLAEKVKTSEMEDAALAIPNLVKSLTVNGEAVSDINAYFADLQKLAAYLNTPSSYKLYLDAIDECEEMIKDPTKGEEVRGRVSEILGRWASELVKHASGFSQMVSNSKAQDRENENTASVYLDLLGNQTLVVSIPKTAEGIRNLSSVVSNRADTQSADSVKALDQSEATRVCVQIAAIAKAARESAESNKGGVKELVASIKQRNDTITAMASSLSNQGEQDQDTMTSVRKAILFINTFLAGAPKLPVHAINKALPRNLAVGLDYVASSIKGAKAADGAAPAAADPKLIAA